MPGRTPVIVMEVPASDAALADRTVLLYGHLDKQPEMTGWRDDLGPWKPVVEGDRLYGRGGADDGYAAFASLLAIEAARAEGLPHARCIVLIEASEESGSPDLPAHVELLASRIGSPELVICLDSGCLDTERLWVTTSLRGLAGGNLTVEVLTEGAHSGQASGIVPSSFRLLRELLDRLEDSATGYVPLPELHVKLPVDRVVEARRTAASLEHAAADEFPFAGATRPMVVDPAEQLVAQGWRPTVSYVGVDGIPPTGRAGNVLRPSTSLQLSVRLPPTCDHEAALGGDRADPARRSAERGDRPLRRRPLRARVERATVRPVADCRTRRGVDGRLRPAGAHLRRGRDDPVHGHARRAVPRRPVRRHRCLVPGSNAHGPDEFLHLPTARRVTECIARLLGAHAASPSP